MGLVESKQILGKLTVACTEAEKKGAASIDPSFYDSTVLNLLRSSWSKLPRGTKQKITGRAKEKKLESRQARRSVAEQDNINISALVASNTSRWINNPELFFRDSPVWDALEGYGLGLLFRLARALEDRTEMDLIGSRFVKVVFFEMQKAFEVQRLHSASLSLLAQFIRETGLVQLPDATIEKDLRRWSREGKRLDLLCQLLSDEDDHGSDETDHGSAQSDHRYLSVLFCLPDEVSDEFIRRLPISTRNGRDADVATLKKRGVSAAAREESTRTLAAKIFKYLWSPVTTHIRDCQHQGNANSVLSQQVFMPSHTPSSVQPKGTSEHFSGHQAPSNNEGAISDLEEMTDVTSTNNSQHLESQQNEDMRFEFDPWQNAVGTLYDLPLAPYEGTHNIQNHDSSLQDQAPLFEFDPWQNAVGALYDLPLAPYEGTHIIQNHASSLQDQAPPFEFDPWKSATGTLYDFPLEPHDDMENAQSLLSSLPNNIPLEPISDNNLSRIPFDRSRNLPFSSPVSVSAA